MGKRKFRLLALAVLAAAAVGTSMAALAADLKTDYDPAKAPSVVKPEEMKKIDAAMPKEAYVKPAKPRKLLVYVESKGYYHDSIPVGAYAIKKLGQATGAFEATLTDDDVNTWNAETLNQYDGIFMDNTVGDHPKSDQGRKDFVEYIKSGHGLMGCHAGADCNHSWPEYADMLGGEFTAHPWGKASVKNEDPTSPLNKMFDGKGFVTNEEIYTFKTTDAKKPQGYGRDKLHVLLSIDYDASAIKEKDNSRKDHDYALSWVHEYGKGHVFYCAIAHARYHFWNPIMLKHYLAGIQYALGDLTADATPSAKINPAPAIVAGPPISSPTFDPK